MPPKSDLPQGTLDLLILKIVALGPVHGYAIAQRLQQVRGTWSRFRKVLSTPRCTGSSIAAFLQRTGRQPRPARGQILPADAEGPRRSSTRKPPVGNDWPPPSALILKISEGGAE